MGESAAQLQRKIEHFADVSTTGQLPRIAAAVEWSQPDPSRQAVCVAGDRAREVSKPLEELRS